MKTFNVLVSVLVFFLVSHSASAFWGTQKKQQPNRTVKEKLSADDKVDYVDRSEKDLTKLQSLNVVVKDAIDDNSVFKIKAVLQDNENIYKVVNSDLKNYVVYFKEGKPVDKDLVTTIITAAGYQSQIKP